jgi:hypothetical protein
MGVVTTNTFVAHTTREEFTGSHWSREPAAHDDAILYEVE